MTNYLKVFQNELKLNKYEQGMKIRHVVQQDVTIVQFMNAQSEQTEKGNSVMNGQRKGFAGSGAYDFCLVLEKNMNPMKLFLKLENLI